MARPFYSLQNRGSITLDESSLYSNTLQMRGVLQDGVEERM